MLVLTVCFEFSYQGFANLIKGICIILMENSKTLLALLMTAPDSIWI